MLLFACLINEKKNEILLFHNHRRLPLLVSRDHGFCFICFLRMLYLRSLNQHGMSKCFLAGSYDQLCHIFEKVWYGFLHNFDFMAKTCTSYYALCYEKPTA